MVWKCFNLCLLSIYCLTTIGIPTEFGLVKAGCHCASSSQESGSCCCQNRQSGKASRSCCTKPENNQGSEGAAVKTCCSTGTKTSGQSQEHGMSALCSCGQDGIHGLYVVTDPRTVDAAPIAIGCTHRASSSVESSRFLPAPAYQPETPPPRTQTALTLPV